MIDLNDRLVEFDSRYSEITLLETAVVTNEGIITGRALVDGKIKGYKLTPIEDL